MRRILFFSLFGLAVVLALFFTLPADVIAQVPPVTTPEPTSIPVTNDQDGDGTLDADDQCVTESGPQQNRGCPVPPTATPVPFVPPTLDPAAAMCLLATSGASSVNVRDIPSAQGAVVGVLDPQSAYSLLLTTSNAEGQWGLTQIPDGFGWVRLDVVRMGGARCADVVLVAPEEGVAMLLPAVQKVREAATRIGSFTPQGEPNTYMEVYDGDLFLGSWYIDPDGTPIPVPGPEIIVPGSSSGAHIPRAVLTCRKAGGRGDYYWIILDLLPVDAAAYEASFVGGVRVASGDVNGDGVGDLQPGDGIALPEDEGGTAYGRVVMTDILVSSAQPDPAAGFVFDPGFRGGVGIVDVHPTGGLVLTFPSDEPDLPGPSLLLGVPSGSGGPLILTPGGLALAIPEQQPESSCAAFDGIVFNEITDGYTQTIANLVNLLPGDQITLTYAINPISLPPNSTNALTVEWRLQPGQFVQGTPPDPQQVPASFSYTTGDEVADPGNWISAHPVWLTNAPEVPKLFSTLTIACTPGS